MPLDPQQAEFIGSGLNRPECVLCTSDGSVFTADWRGGVSHIHPDGSVTGLFTDGNPSGVLPNGIALEKEGTFLLADLGAQGGLWRLHRDGQVEPVLREVDGEELPPANFVLVDSRGRTWLTVSTRLQPRALGYRSDVADGFIVLLDGGGTRIVADGLGYTNEVQIDASGDYLYVNETFARRTSRFPLHEDGSLGRRETVAEFGAGTFPDGLCFDVDGGIWVTSIVSNRVIRIDPDGSQQVVLEDSDPDHLEWVEQAFVNEELGRPHLDNVKSATLKNISCLAFGGPDMKTMYLGCLLGDRIATYRSPVAGLKPVHWNWTV